MADLREAKEIAKAYIRACEDVRSAKKDIEMGEMRRSSAACRLEEQEGKLRKLVSNVEPRRIFQVGTNRIVVVEYAGNKEGPPMVNIDILETE